MFTTQEERDNAQRSYVIDLPAAEISDFPNHPFKVRMDESMVELADSVKQHGILVPSLVRPMPDGSYQMVSGHRRKRAAELAELPTVPCIVRELTDDEAIIIMVDSNLQRERVLPSEKAFAYKMKLDAMKRQGERTDLTCATPLHNTGNPLTPNLAPGYMLGDGAIVSGGTGVTVAPPDFNTIPSGIVSGNGTNTGGTATPTPSTGFTEVTSDLYYKGGYLATLKIPSLNVNVKVYEGTGSSVLAKGAGHFEDTSIWDGNCAIAGHNRGANCYFGDIHNLNVGDTITLTTRLGTRTYSVTSVNKISETDNSLLAPTAENCVTLFTCVRNQRAYRWAVRAVEV